MVCTDCLLCLYRLCPKVNFICILCSGFILKILHELYLHSYQNFLGMLGFLLKTRQVNKSTEIGRQLLRSQKKASDTDFLLARFPQEHHTLYTMHSLCKEVQGIFNFMLFFAVHSFFLSMKVAFIGVSRAD